MPNASDHGFSIQGQLPGATADPVGFKPPRITARVDVHIPRGSGDAEYRIIDADSDNGDVLAIVDPNMTMEDPAAFAEDLVAAFNSIGEALEAARALHRSEPCAGNLPLYDRLVRALEGMEAKRPSTATPPPVIGGDGKVYGA